MGQTTHSAVHAVSVVRDRRDLLINNAGNTDHGIDPTPPPWSSRSTVSAACSPTSSPSTPPSSPKRRNEEMQRLAEASNAQNEELKKISAWAAILFAPTLIGTV